MELMARMDYVWCWRPGSFENKTLELSTKLVEGVASGWRCICYPSATNRAVLGDDYPFFARTIQEIGEILAKPPAELPQGLAQRLIATHSLPVIANRFSQDVIGTARASARQRILFAGHDYKFIDPFISRLKKVGHPVRRDAWDWGKPLNEKRSAEYRDWADIIFCEWGLANAVWHANNAVPGKKIYVRMHLQEVNARARRFGAELQIDNIEKVIFVQEQDRQEALRLWGWPEDKTVLVPNFVLSDEFRLADHAEREEIAIGMVGIIPQRKRFDRAVDVLHRLISQGHDAKLYIKGPRPETVEYMHAPGRSVELEYYKDVYRIIDANSKLKNAIEFEAWGNDVAIWYRKIDHILSCSDFESFHYAIADGVLSGCQPVVWPWSGSDSAYSADWIVSDEQDAARRILAWRHMPSREKRDTQLANRDLVIARYGHEKIFASLLDVLGLREH